MTGGELADAVALNGAIRVAAEAVRTFGDEPQLRQTQEECAELIAAINRDARGRDPERVHVSEEAGQAFVMLLQVREIIGHDRFDAAVRAAQAKTKARIDARKAKVSA